MNMLRTTIMLATLAVLSFTTAPAAFAAVEYTSPTYGYTVSFDDPWTVESETSDDGEDQLRFTNGPVVGFLTGFASDRTPEECIDDMVVTMQNRPRHDNFAFANPIQSADGSATAVIGYTFVTAAGEQLEGRNQITCWAIDNGTALVRLEFLMLTQNFLSQQPAIVAVESEVERAIAAREPVAVEASPEPASPEASPAASPTAPPSPTAEATATPEPSPTQTATVTPEPSPTQTATATETPEPSPSPTQTPTAEPTATSTITPTSEPQTADAGSPEPAASPLAPSTQQPEATAEAPADTVEGNTYTSATFGYTLAWEDLWTVAADESDQRGDYFSLEHPSGIFADLIGEPYPADRGECFDFLVEFYENGEEYSNVVGIPDPESAVPGVWDFTGIIEVTYTDEATGSTVDLLNYAACTHLSGQGAIVSLEQVVVAGDIDPLVPVMDALRAGFEAPDGLIGEATPAPASGAASPTAISGSASPVAITSYTSATYGYALTWDSAWSVEEEGSEPEGDTLVLTNGPVLAELFSEPWDPASGSCFDWIVASYEDSPEYASVRAFEDSTSRAPGIWEHTGAIALFISEEGNAPGGEQITYVACSELLGQAAIVSLEQFVSPEDAPGQLPAMDALRNGFSLE